MKKCILGLGLFLSVSLLLGQNIACSAESQARLSETLDLLEAAEMDVRIGEAVCAVGKMWMGTPYVEKTLEVPETESLVLNMEGMDCTTFLENVVVMARLVRLSHYSVDAFYRELSQFRYREGKPNGYTSRLHYFSDWIYTHSENHLVCDVTRMLGGVPYKNQVDFMSTHPSAYRQLSADSSLVVEIAAQEHMISQRAYDFIPQEAIASADSLIKEGDIIAITTDISGLDIAHVGFAVKVGDATHLMHASTGVGEVTISPKPLADYVQGNKRQTGIMVVRLVEP